MRLRLLLSGRHWSVYAVARDSGRCDLREFLEGHDRQADVDSLLALLGRIVDDPQGPRLLPDARCHRVVPEVWEFIAGRIRVFWFYGGGAIVICTHGISKKSQKTPDRDKARALRLKMKYEAAAAAGELRMEDDDEGR